MKIIKDFRNLFGKKSEDSMQRRAEHAREINEAKKEIDELHKKTDEVVERVEHLIKQIKQ